ncbi:hypothetical protein GCM10011378_26930 [Hymenobacter glacieicola]|uniref:Uncharacterized protein n=1 Tax=Hymenobacter glacieicola TaxID=1562124 RepID=A0ABQ1WXV8_9BACT|nr:hypothetical protein GCM10011378_26930 [Hymenobacter glacieicola]
MAGGGYHLGNARAHGPAADNADNHVARVSLNEVETQYLASVGEFVPFVIPTQEESELSRSNDLIQIPPASE